MTEPHHPLAEQALALVDDPRFCEWLDARLPLTTDWSHGRYSARRWLLEQCGINSRYSARRWLLEQCGIESLAHLAVDPEAATAFHQIACQFAEWDRNGELEA